MRVASGGGIVGAEHVVVEAGFRVVILSGEAEVHEGLIALKRVGFAEGLGDAVPHDALLRVRHLLRRAEVVVVDVIDLPVGQLRDGQRSEVDVLFTDASVVTFGDQVALFVVDVIRRVVEVVETVARAGFLHALAERVGFVADGRRAHALIGQAGETVAGVISERPVRLAVGLAREVAVGSVSILHAAEAADALQHVRGRVIGITSGARARVVAVPVALREALAQAVAVGIVEAHSGEQAGRRGSGV